ncbi:NAD-glutamate dehydrogenase [Vibrio sinaloensis]|nr:NAD-glutamate dehydrogenase [Vibrio sinaloensis]
MAQWLAYGTTLAKKKADDVSVRVFNPTVSRQGWQSTHTIVEIVVQDSPFLVDSIKMALSRLDLASHLMLHGPTQVERNAQGEITAINQGEGALQSLFHIEVDRLSAKEAMTSLKEELLSILKDTSLVVQDWLLMVEKLEEVTNQVEAQQGQVEVERDRYDETINFLRWLGKHNFTFMGYKEYDLVSVDGDTELRPTPDKGLGLFANRDRVRSVKLSDFPDSARLEAKKSRSYLS